MHSIRLSASRCFILVVLSGVVLFFRVSTCSAQDESAAFAIRIETREVQVPVMVVDKTYSEARGTPERPVGGDIGVVGLTAKYFEILEDGVEQQVKSVRVEPYRVWLVVDNVAGHKESSCTPAGVWGGPDPYPDQSFHAANIDQGGVYLVSYAPAPSSPGSCHHLQVNVKGFDKKDSADSIMSPVGGMTCDTRSLPHEITDETRYPTPTPYQQESLPQLYSRLSYPLSASCKGRTHLTMQLPRMPMQEIYRTKKGASITTKVNG
jgi:hypothetical protein